MRYPILEQEAARSWWFTWHSKCEQQNQRLAPVAGPEFSYVECPSSVDSKKEIEQVITSLSSLYDQVDGEERLLDTNRFEARAAEIIHQGLSESEALADPRFWIWAAVIAGPQLISRRYPLKGQTLKAKDVSDVDVGMELMQGEKLTKWLPDKANFFSTSARETFFYRLWMRGQLGHVSDMPDPYELARCGDIDFWRSHIFRQMSLECESLRVEFIRFQFPSGEEGKPRLSQTRIRDLIKHIKRAAANVFVDEFDRDQAREFILRQWQAIEK